ncbi:MAG: hypothetical protein H7319_19300 [Spirosoma sp.]|nr:hypothetical protein [Spirosoma sp.]
MLRFVIQVAGFVLLYGLAMLATFPFLVYFGKPKPWQRVATFLMSFPLDNEKLGLFSFTGTALVILANGLLWGIGVVGLCRLGKLVISSL